MWDPRGLHPLLGDLSDDIRENCTAVLKTTGLLQIEKAMVNEDLLLFYSFDLGMLGLI